MYPYPCAQVGAADESFARASELNPKLDLTVVAQVRREGRNKINAIANPKDSN